MSVLDPETTLGHVFVRRITEYLKPRVVGFLMWFCLCSASIAENIDITHVVNVQIVAN